MKRILILICSVLALAGCTSKEARPSEFLLDMTYVGGSRARLTISAKNPSAYYVVGLVSANSENYNMEDVDMVQYDLDEIEDSYSHFDEYGIEGSYLDVFCYQGSRQVSFTSLMDDVDFKCYVCQIHPKTRKMIGAPVVRSFHTKPVPQRDMHFEVTFGHDSVTIVPSDTEHTYFWDYEETKSIYEDYYSPYYYAYALVGMYSEYGFSDTILSKGTETWEFSLQDNTIKDEGDYTLVVLGCEDGEFTTEALEIRFTYNKGEITVLEVLEPGEDGGEG